MGRVHIANDSSGRLIVSFPYGLLLVSKLKTIDGRRCHPAEKHWGFPNTEEILECHCEKRSDEAISKKSSNLEGDCSRLRRERSIERFKDG
jgi:hypothetical protein